jgi:hypothetical protein
MTLFRGKLYPSCGTFSRLVAAKATSYSASWGADQSSGSTENSISAEKSGVSAVGGFVFVATALTRYAGFEFSGILHPICKSKWYGSDFTPACIAIVEMKYKAAEFQTSSGMKVSADRVMNGFSFVEE